MRNCTGLLYYISLFIYYININVLVWDFNAVLSETLADTLGHIKVNVPVILGLAPHAYCQVNRTVAVL